MKNEEKKCVCQKCGANGTVTIWHEIGDDKAQEVMDMSLFCWTCPACGHVYKFIYPSTYMNKDKAFVVRYQGNDKEFDQEICLEGYILRDCNSQEELAEKVRILEADLDDRAVELMKLLIFAKIHVEDETMEQIQFFQVAEDGDFEFTIWTGEGPDGIHISEQVYENVRELAGELPELEPGYHVIDLEWAGLQVSENEGD